MSTSQTNETWYAVVARVLGWLAERDAQLILDGVTYDADAAPAKLADYYERFREERRPFYQYLGLVP